MQKKTKRLKESIRFAIGDCSLGSVIIAYSDVGLCAIFLGNDHKELTEELQARFSNALLVPGDDERIGEILSEIIELINSPHKKMNIILDERGTGFQLRVWKALREIPIGKTVSYTEIAKKMGLPKAVRAVAGACAANPLAIVTPCHRVVKMDGSLSGYRWGVERKQKCLQLEGAF